jgi:predicted O-methyltransferase YrrM
VIFLKISYAKKVHFFVSGSIFNESTFQPIYKRHTAFFKKSDGNYQLVFIDAPQSSYHKKVSESLNSNNVSVNDKSAIVWDIHVNNKKTK